MTTTTQRETVHVYGPEGKMLMPNQGRRIKARLEAVRQQRLKGNLDEYRELYGPDPEYRVERELRVRACKRNSDDYYHQHGTDSVWKQYHNWTERVTFATQNPVAYLGEFGRDEAYQESLRRRVEKRAKRQI